ncbi:Uncharacterised protein [Staphylococcus caeli]|uniref:Uncharacterized protein n=1 Tax=Staphylococcus caeli TaxID=2201815 RepID=A0A1D4RGX8_9STAP|nr:hypothetical protein [Staphylococcus caeli]SCT42392.1 Uncharacterised protein [Staphylococcus caeli]SCT46774.1 Uncharacterised protein [Staphylococcus caeli]
MEFYNSYEEKYNYYKNLLNLSYNQIVQSLIEKYGEVLDDYYKENSYKRFLNKEIKSITRGKYSKTSEGLYCHHILENEYENISNKEYIDHFKYPHEYHKKENLVYCDLIEHMILHSIITKETDGEYGVKGLSIMIKPTVKEWYIDEYEPKKKWMQVAKKRAYLPKKNILKIFSSIDKMLGNIKEYKDLEEREKRAEEEFRELERQKEAIIEQQKLEHEERIRQKQIEREKSIQRHMQNLNISREEFESNEKLIREEAYRYINQDNIFELRLSKKTPRSEVLQLLHFYEELYGSEYNSSILNTVKEDLIQDISELSKKVELKLENAQYYKKDGNYNIKSSHSGISWEVTPENANIIINEKSLQ